MNLDTLISQFGNAQEPRIGVVLEALNAEIRSDLVSTAPAKGNISATNIARLLLFYAYSLSDDKKNAGKRASANTPNWAGIATELSSFVQSLPTAVTRCCCRNYTDDKIAQFATLASRVKGTNSPYFYSTLALYLIHLNDKGAFDKPFLLTFLPRYDQKVVSSLAHIISGRLDRKLAPAEDLHKSDNRLPEFEAAVRFNVLKSNNERLKRFIRYYGSGDKGIVHLVVYRAMKSDPLRLIKTFLTISPPTKANDGANNAVFSHFYKAPSEKRDGFLRFSGGKVLPLDQGIYLVGGTRQTTPHNKRHPFSSLKVLTFEWIDFDQLHPLLSILVMSTNYKGRMFVSRAVARVTPMTHHSELELDAIRLTDLNNNLKADYRREQQYLNREIPDISEKHWQGNNTSHFLDHTDLEDASAVADFIVRNTNNNPRGNNAWTAREGFTRVGDKNVETLTSAKLQSVIEDSLTDNKNNEFSTENGETYQFWSSTRFGPLTSDSEP